MASSPEAPPGDDMSAESPPADSSTSPSPPSPQSPPPDSSISASPPPSPPADSTETPTDSSSSAPPPSTTPAQSSPADDSAAPPSSTTSPEAPAFSPPSPHESDSPPSPGSRRSSPRSGSGTRHSGSTSGQNNSSNSNTDEAMIAGIVAVVLVILALLIICIICLRRKNKRQYYKNQGPPPRGGGQYQNSSTKQSYPSPTDHVIKFASPAGVMRTPIGGWGVQHLPPGSHTSSEFSSNYSGQHPIPTPSPPQNMLGYGAKSQFTYEDLAAATAGFSQANLLGQGGFGFVHKGVLPSGKEVAVKSLKAGSGQGEREFQAEVEIISRVHHRHLASLVGYCIAGDKRMLVYEFVPNRTLEFHLHGKGQPVMDWPSRLRIAIGSAKGLAYLHEDCHPRIIHRDIKSANILLDLKFEAKVADFGLAKLNSDNFTHVSTRVMGTFGYLAPEYAASGKLTEKSDVFSFGVMLLELITGRRPVDRTNKTMEDSLVDWARPLLSKASEDGNYHNLVDPRLGDNYVPCEMARMISSAAASIRHSARTRPRMSQIVRALDGVLSLDDLNEGAKPGQSAAYNSSNSEEIYDTCAYNADMMKFRKMVMSGQELNSATSEYGLNQSSSSSSDSGETDVASPRTRMQKR